MPSTRLIIVALATAALAAPPPFRAAEAATPLNDLLAAARGAHPMICALAAHSVSNGFGGLQPPYPVLTASVTPLRDALREATTPGSAPTLLAALGEPDPCVREIAARLLGRTRHVEGRRGLEAQLAASSPDARAAAAYALGMTQGEPSSALVAVLGDASASVRGNAVWALGMIGQRDAAGSVWGLVRDSEAPVRAAALQTLRHLEARDSIPLILRALRTDPDAEVRRVAAWALAELDPSSAAEALVQTLREDRDARVREMAAWALAQVRRPDVAPALVAVLRDDNEEVRATAIWALGTLGSEEALPALVETLADEDAEVRGRAIWAIGTIQPSSAPDGLAAALGDEDDEVRLRAAWAIGEIGDTGLLPALSAALERESNDRVREAELRAMLMMGERDEAALARLLENGSAEIRSQAVAALAGRALSPWPWPWPWPQPRPFP